MRTAFVVILLVSLVGCRRGVAEPPRALDRGRFGARSTMTHLHRAGGVPASWRFTVPPGDAAARRQTFLDVGCASCHRVDGERASEPD